MMVIKTKFSKEGLFSVLLFFIPCLFAFFPSMHPIREELSLSSNALVILYFLSLAAVVLTFVLIENISALPFSKENRGVSLAFVFLGIYYILWVYSFIGRANSLILLSIKVFGSAYLVSIAFDRKNWVALAAVVIHFALGISMTIISFCI